MDSHADTSCAGANWKAIELTGLTCDVSPFTQDYDAVKDVGDDVLKKRINEFEETLEEQLNNENFQSEEVDVDFYLEDVEIAEDDANTPTDEEYGDMIKEEKKDHVDEFDNNVYDRYLGTELNINRGDGEIRGRVVKRARGNNGEFTGRSHNNPLMDSREYWIEVPDRDEEKYAANVIAENLYSQVDHCSDATAISKDDGFVISSSGNRTSKRTTRGWELCREWKDKTSNWVKLKDLKDSNPVESAEYAVASLL